jgi:hypothetical protein
MKSKSTLEEEKWNIKWIRRFYLNLKNFTMPKGLTSNFISKFFSPYLLVECVFKDV